MVLASNRGPVDWYSLFPNLVVAESVLDLVNSSHHVFMDGRSYRSNKRPGRGGPKQKEGHRTRTSHGTGVPDSVNEALPDSTNVRTCVQHRHKDGKGILAADIKLSWRGGDGLTVATPGKARTQSHSPVLSGTGRGMHAQDGSSASGASFEDILAGAKANQPWACQRLYSALAPAVAGYARAQGVKDDEDLTSEVFLGVFSGLRSFVGTEAEFRSWVFTIAHHRLMDERRRDSRRPEFEAIDVISQGQLGMSGQGDTEEDALVSLGSDRVRRLLGQLSPEQRSVVALRILGNLTVDEVARVVHKHPRGVKALQRRGLSKLRSVLEQETVPA